LKEHGALVEKKQLNELLMKVRKLYCFVTVWISIIYVSLLLVAAQQLQGALCCSPYLIRAGVIGAQYMHMYVAARNVQRCHKIVWVASVSS
jgi:hypothetical protein